MPACWRVVAVTWNKHGTEFYDECADAGLSDAAFRTHVEAIGWIYRVERPDMRIPKHLLRRFAGSDQWEIAAKDLAEVGFWQDDGDAYVIVHHRDVVRESIAAQVKHREQARIRQQRKRKRDARVTRDVDRDVTRDVSETQTDRQSPKYVAEKRKAGKETETHARKCDRCQSAPTKVNGAGVRLCQSCAPHLWQDSS